MNKKLILPVWLALFLCAEFLLVGCPASTPTSAPAPTPTATPIPTPRAVATWDSPGVVRGIAIKGSVLYAGDAGGSVLRAYNLSGTPVPGWTPVPIPTVQGVAVDTAGNIFVANGNANIVTKYNPTATPIATIAVGTSAYGIALDGSDNVYVTGAFGSGTVKKFNSAGAAVTQWSVSNTPWGIGISGSTVFVGTISDKKISVFDLSGVPGISWTIGNNGLAFAFDSSGNVYVAGDSLGIDPTAQRFTTVGALQVQWGLYNSVGIALDASNNIYISNYNSTTITKYAP